MSDQEFASRNGWYSEPTWIHLLSLRLTLCFVFSLKVNRLIHFTKAYEWATLDYLLLILLKNLPSSPPTDNVPQSLPALPRYPALGDSYHFSPAEPTISNHSRDFYRVTQTDIWCLKVSVHNIVSKKLRKNLPKNPQHIKILISSLLILRSSTQHFVHFQ